MPHKTHAILIGIALLVSSCTMQRLERMAPVETYPDDTWLQAQTHKKALVIVAHDDDAISSAGTISMLTAAGWSVNMLCFYTAIPEDSQRNAQRMLDVQKAAAAQGIELVQWHQLKFRKDHGTNAMLYGYLTPEQRDTTYNRDTLRTLISTFIKAHDPVVIFTLDDIIGGYGHPDHIEVSHLVRTIIADDPGNVQRIYQAVFTPHQANTVMQDLPIYAQARAGCACNGQPLPNVQVRITSSATQKQLAMQQYSTEQHNLQKFWPKYDRYPAVEYFSLFDREFFHVITID